MSRLGAEYHRINDVARAVKERVLLGTQEQVKLVLQGFGSLIVEGLEKTGGFEFRPYFRLAVHWLPSGRVKIRFIPRSELRRLLMRLRAVQEGAASPKEPPSGADSSNA